MLIADWIGRLYICQNSRIIQTIHHYVNDGRQFQQLFVDIVYHLFGIVIAVGIKSMILLLLCLRQIESFEILPQPDIRNNAGMFFVQFSLHVFHMIGPVIE